MRRLLALLAVAACGGHPAPAPVANDLAPEAVEYLAWVQDDHAAETRWFDAAGHLRATAPGILVAAGGRLWRIVSTDVSFPLRTCDELALNPPPPPSGAGEEAHGDTLAAVPTDGGAPVSLGDAIGDADYAELDWGTVPIGGLGPYLFLETSASTYGCGAHGGTDVSAEAFDLRVPGHADVVSAAEFDLARADAAARIGADGTYTDELDPASVSFGEARPMWLDDGSSTIVYLAWADACYACSVGDWSSYTASSWIEAPTWPRALAALPPLPAALTDALAGSVPDRPMGVSWGTPDASWDQAFRR